MALSGALERQSYAIPTVVRNQSVHSFAGVTLGFICDDEKFLESISERYAVYASVVHRPDYSIRISLVEDARLIERDFPEGELFACESDGAHGALEIIRDRLIFDRALRVILSMRLIERQGLLVHGTAIRDNDLGYLFIGCSGAGKTTCARISARSGRTVMTDELAIVKNINGKFFVYGTPFWGEHQGVSTAEGMPLAGIIDLLKSDEIALVGASPDKSVAGLMRCVVNFDPALHTHDACLGLVSDLVQSVHCRQLRFRRDRDFWNVLKSS